MNNIAIEDSDDKEMFDAQMISNLKKRIAELENHFLWLNTRRNNPGIADYVQFVIKDLNIPEGGADEG